MSAPRVDARRLWLPAALALALWAIGQAGEPRDQARSAEVVALFTPGVTRFVPLAPAEPVPVSALTLTLGRGPSYFYARSKGLWRCLNAGGALCEEAPLLELFERLQRARGLPEGPIESLDLQALGLDPGARVRLDLHGSQVLKEGAAKDILASVELGQIRPGLGGPARLADSDLVLGLAEDLMPRLGPGGSRGELPPLVSPRALPAAWPGWAAGIERVFVDPSEGQSFEFVPLPQDPDRPLAAGLDRFLIRHADGSELECNPVLSTGFFLFLSRAPREALPGEGDLPPPDRQRPALRLTLLSKDKSLLEVVVLQGFGPGRRVLLEDLAGTAGLISPEVARLLAPTPQQLISGKENPWDSYLR
jgi:hypothetical protein